MTERNESADQAQDAIRRLKQKLTLADERIRELEAELAWRNDVPARAAVYRERDAFQARAEKAEGFLDCKNEPCAIVGGWCLRHAKAEIVRWEKGSGIFTFSESKED